MPQDEWNNKKVTNSIIDLELEHWEQFGTKTYPSLIINDRVYRGQIEPTSVFNAICASFVKAPETCN